MRNMRKSARICLIIENMDLDPLCSGSGRHSRVEAAISQPFFLSATSARCPIIPHRALDRCAAILPPLLSPLMFPSTLRAGPGRQQLTVKEGLHITMMSGQQDRTTRALPSTKAIQLLWLLLLVVLGGPYVLGIIVISALS